MYHYRNNEYLFNARKQDNAIEWCIDITMLSLKRGMDVVVSNTFTKRRYVESYANIANMLGCKVKVYRMMGDFVNIHNVPQNILDNMKNNFEDYPGEEFVYPNPYYDKNDNMSTEYRITDIKVGDHIKLDLNDKEAIVENVSVASYGMIQLNYRTLDGETGIVYCGDAQKINYNCEQCK